MIRVKLIALIVGAGATGATALLQLAASEDLTSALEHSAGAGAGATVLTYFALKGRIDGAHRRITSTRDELHTRLDKIDTAIDASEQTLAGVNVLLARIDEREREREKNRQRREDDRQPSSRSIT